MNDRIRNRYTLFKSYYNLNGKYYSTELFFILKFNF